MKKGIFSYSGTARGLKAILSLQAAVDSVRDATKKLKQLRQEKPLDMVAEYDNNIGLQKCPFCHTSDFANVMIKNGSDWAHQECLNEAWMGHFGR